nr:VOC family protein [Sphingomonas sp. CDS-1]
MLDVRNIVSGQLFQLGYVFPQTAIGEKYLTGMGAAGFVRFDDAAVHSQTLQGMPMECSQNLTFGFLGPLNVELVEPIEGRNIYTDFLDANEAGGLHHIAWKVADIDAAAAAMKQAGLVEVQTGCFGEGTRFSYFDTRDPLGHFVELLYFDDETEMLFAELRKQAA